MAEIQARGSHITGSSLTLNYLLQWKIAVARNMLAREQMSGAEAVLANRLSVSKRVQHGFQP